MAVPTILAMTMQVAVSREMVLTAEEGAPEFTKSAEGLGKVGGEVKQCAETNGTQGLFLTLILFFSARVARPSTHLAPKADRVEHFPIHKYC